MSTNRMSSWLPRELVFLLVTGAILRLALWFWFAPLNPQIDDEQAHIQLAHCLVESGEYAFSPGKLTSLRPPLYPAMVAGVFTIAGQDHFQAVRLVQILISLITIVLVYRLGFELYSGTIGLRAATLFCFYPSFLGFNNLILSEVLYTFFLVAGTLALVSGIKRSGYQYLIGAGLLLGLGALTRSILFPMSPFLAVLIFFCWKETRLRRVLASLAFLIPFAAVLTPWAVRNSQLQHTPIVVDCMGGRNFMMGNYEHTPFYRSWDAIAISGDREWIKILNDRYPDMHDLTQGKVDQLAGKEAIRFIKENPGLTLKRDIIKFFDFWGLERELIAGANRSYFGSLPSIVVALIGLVICGFYAVVLMTGIFGMALRSPVDRRFHALIFLMIGFHCAVHSVVFAHSRYHLPVMPFIMIYSAAALSGPGILRERNRLGFWIALAFCSVVLIGWLWGGLAGDGDKLLQIFGIRS